jgi:hypothetical protein
VQIDGELVVISYDFHPPSSISSANEVPLGVRCRTLFLAWRNVDIY